MGLFICFSFIKKIVHLIMLGLNVVIIWGNHFKHNAHQTAIIIPVILYFACVCILMLYYNHAYIVFTAVLVGWGKIWVIETILVNH